MEINSSLVIRTTEMHTGGEPVRVIESGFPKLIGATLLDKMRYARQKQDHIRKFLIYEPRGHYDMFGVIMEEPDREGADMAAIFIHNEGYCTMCGHATISLGRYLVDNALVPNISEPETEVNLQVPCGLIKLFVEYNNGRAGAVRFHSVPAFAFALDVVVDVAGIGPVKVDIGFGGTYYAFVTGDALGVDVRTSRTALLVEVATAVSEAVRKTVTFTHPESEDLAFLHGTIITDGEDMFDATTSTAQLCVFADREVDRSPCGSGTTARIAVQHARGQISQGQKRTFLCGKTGSEMKGMVVKQTRFGAFDAIIVEICGRGYYSGKCTFTVEDDDPLKGGFLLK